MTEPTRAICQPWVTLADLPDDRPTLPTKTSPTDASDDWWESICWQASELLFALSGRLFTGACESTVRVYSPTRRGSGPLDGTIAGAVFGGSVGMGGGSSVVPGLHSRDSWGGRGAVVAALPGHPVTEIVDASLGGEEIELDFDPASALLSRVDGRAFPLLREAPLLVTYRHGTGPDIGGRLAAKTLALELGNASRGDETRLPKKMQSISRQGVTVSFASTFESLAKGRTGIWEIDSWLSSVSRQGMTARPSVHSPDTARVRRVVIP